MGDIENSDEEIYPSDKFEQQNVEDFNDDLEKKRQEFSRYLANFKP